MNVPVKMFAGKFPFNFSGTQYQVYKALIRRIRAYISGSSVLVGSQGVNSPDHNVGPYFLSLGSGLSRWLTWNPSIGRYGEDIKQLDNSGYHITLGAEPLTDSRDAIFPNQGGTVALLQDVFVPRDTVVIDQTALNIDWSLGNDFIIRLTQDSTFTSSNVEDGQKITVTVENNGTAFGANFSALIQWPGGSEPAQPVATGGSDAVGIYYLRRINGVTYGELAFSATTQPSDTLPPSRDYLPPNYWKGSKAPQQPF